MSPAPGRFTLYILYDRKKQTSRKIERLARYPLPVTPRSSSPATALVHTRCSVRTAAQKTIVDGRLLPTATASSGDVQCCNCTRVAVAAAQRKFERPSDQREVDQSEGNQCEGACEGAAGAGGTSSCKVCHRLADRIRTRRLAPIHVPPNGRLGGRLRCWRWRRGGTSRARCLLPEP